MVLRIVQNRIYTGDLVQGKRTTPNYKVKKAIVKPEEEWVIKQNTHEPLVSKEQFALVQEVLKLDTRISHKEETVAPLAGKICCYDCKNRPRRRLFTEGLSFSVSGNGEQKGEGLYVQKRRIMVRAFGGIKKTLRPSCRNG